jgi:hypothetical protein
MTAKIIAVRNPGIAIFRFIVNSTSANSKNGHPPGIVRASNAIASRSDGWAGEEHAPGCTREGTPRGGDPLPSATGGQEKTGEVE